MDEYSFQTSTKPDTQNSTQVSAVNRPTNDDAEVWRRYWIAQGQSWRTEPEIKEDRQKFLAQRRSIFPNIKQAIYPFKDIKLSRADVEWLLATHDNGRGPVDWSDAGQRERQGLDLRGALLNKENLSGLPMASIQGGLTGKEYFYASPEECKMAAVQMEGVLLIGTSLEGAKLNEANLKGANLYRTHLESAEFQVASLEKAYLNEAYLGGANFKSSRLEGAFLSKAHLEGRSTPSADLRRAFLDATTNLNNIIISSKEHGAIIVADVCWNGANLSVVNWSQLKMLGDEHIARQRMRDGRVKDKITRLKEYEAATRANRQLSVALQGQGMNEIAARFAYRANVLQRKVLWYRLIAEHEPEQAQKPWHRLVQQWFIEGLRSIRKFGSLIFSLFLDALAGYGFRPGRALGWYLLVVLGYAAAYFQLEHLAKLHLSFLGALIFSVTAFHGRGFFPGGFGYDDPVTILAASEAVIGLLIELSFIATFTQRFFGK
jgi:uncharacterized protein YjbI with pentapeptide repeats